MPEYSRQGRNRRQTSNGGRTRQYRVPRSGIVRGSKNAVRRRVTLDGAAKLFHGLQVGLQLDAVAAVRPPEAGASRKKVLRRGPNQSIRTLHGWQTTRRRHRRGVRGRWTRPRSRAGCLEGRRIRTTRASSEAHGQAGECWKEAHFHFCAIRALEAEKGTYLQPSQALVDRRSDHMHVATRSRSR